MIVAAMIGYYVFAVGLLLLVGYLAGRKNILDFTTTADRAIADLREISVKDAEYDAAFIREREDWLRGKADEESEPVSHPEEKVRALVLTFRVAPGASVDELAAMTAHLLLRLNQREGELGGDGMDMDTNGNVFGPDRIVLRLIPSKQEGAAARVAVLVEEMNLASRGARDRPRDHDESIQAKIARNFKAPLPENALRQLEMAAVA